MSDETKIALELGELKGKVTGLENRMDDVIVEIDQKHEALVKSMEMRLTEIKDSIERQGWIGGYIRMWREARPAAVVLGLFVISLFAAMSAKFGLDVYDPTHDTEIAEMVEEEIEHAEVR